MQFRIVAIIGIALALLLPAHLCAAPLSDAPQSDPQPHLYFFTSSNCEPCRHVKPEIQRLIDKKYPVTTINVDHRPEVARQFNVNRWPTTILVYDGKVIQRNSGLIDAPTMAGWFAALKRPAKTGPANTLPTPQPSKLATDAKRANDRGAKSQGMAERLRSSFESSTVHKGTRTPGNDAELNAMRATVRIKVEDPVGTSYATGTVIHSKDGECLVMTCGHVFRESKGTGTISAEYGFDTQELKTVPGTLVQYDAGPRDIALIAINTGVNIPPVQVAPLKFPVLRGDQVFSIGCDHGEDATIRRTRIKNQALYDQAKKYDIYGRPVDGRSGGGLFTAGGQLIGVCNAAAVEVDEGVYTSLENMYWQLAEVNLEHLVEPRSNLNQAPISLASAKSAAPALVASPTRLAPTTPSSSQLAQLDRQTAPQSNPQLNPITPPRRPEITKVSQIRPDSSPIAIPDSQIIVVFQSKSNPDQAETVVINQPSQDLVRQLRSESQSLESRSDPTDFARLRREMPVVSPPKQRFAEEYRAQSRR